MENLILITVTHKDGSKRASCFSKKSAGRIFVDACKMGLDPEMREVTPAQSFEGVRYLER